MTDRFREKYNDLARIVLKHYVKTRKGENIVLSPMSILILMAMVADSVDGPARDEIIEVLGDDFTLDDIKQIIREIQSDITESDSMISANAVCVNNSLKHTITKGYEEEMKEVFDSSLFTSIDLITDVNNWVKDNTKGYIEKIADDTMKDMVACFLNAIAFESEWGKKYSEDDIYEDEFHNSDGTTSEVEMLHSTESIYVEDECFTGFIKNYKDEKYSFMALLPKRNSTAVLIRGLKQVDFPKLIKSLCYCDVHVTMPEFKYDACCDLTEYFKEQGINTIFSQHADFSPMSSEWLEVDSIIHKAHIEVDRMGTKAAAVSMAVVCAGCAPLNIKSIYLNRPFVYAIIDNETSLPVFAGVLNHV